jgi:hypothetical protein
MVAKDARSRRLVSLVDRPCKLHFRQDTVFPFPVFAEIKLPACYGVQEPKPGKTSPPTPYHIDLQATR